MEPRIEIAEGTAFEVLLAAAAIADADWREVFALGPAAYSEALAVVGSDFVQRVESVGRYGWINLTGLLTRSPPPWNLDRLMASAQSCPPEALHYIAIGGDRRQLVDAVPANVIQAALAGESVARDALEAAFASNENVLQATPWLVNSPSDVVHRVVTELLQIWQERLLNRADEVTLAAALHERAVAARARLATTTGRDFLERTIGGVHYDPAGLDRLVMISSFRVAPIIVVVDGREHRVILHPPLRATPLAHDANCRLLELCRALGDKTRLRLLTELSRGEMTAVALAGALGAPRTTLLHHLAMLRSAGLIKVTVTPGGATVYRLRPEGLSELSRSAADFIPNE